MTELAERVEAVGGDRVVKFAREEDRLRFFIQGLAAMSLGTPRGHRTDAHHAKLLRQIRSAARTMLELSDDD